ncbi:MAG: alpha/beta fold hydrolase [Alphaproteobacteria bacterium]|nr:alpha/beta fold hydrolase [Alphaproteobacteria bacterium]
MIDIVIPGAAGKIRAVYHKAEDENAPMAVVLSGSPHHKCHMNDRVSYAMFRAFMDAGFSVVRFNYRGVGDSDGNIGTIEENRLDIATVVDWIQNDNENGGKLWMAGHQLGAWYVLQMLMRRPEIAGFALVSPDNTVSNFDFLSPNPNKGVLLQGEQEGEDAHNFGVYLTQLLKKQALISLETIKIKKADANYSQANDLRQMYNDLKAYIGREKEDMKLL